jgi:hypothetical protein
MAWALLDLGDVDEATQVAWRAVAQAREMGRQVVLADALRAAAMAATRQGRWTEAQGAIQEGLSLARRIGYSYGEARILLVSGDLYTMTDQPEPARKQLEAARAIFLQLGAHRDIDRAELLLTALG